MPYKDPELRKQYNLRSRNAKIAKGYVQRKYWIPLKYEHYVQRIVKYIASKFEIERSNNNE